VEYKRPKKKAPPVFSLVNMMGSSISRLSDKTLYLNAGPEIGGSGNKIFCCPNWFVVLLAFAMNGEIENGQKMLRNVSNLIETDLSCHCSVITDIVKKVKDKMISIFLQGYQFRDSWRRSPKTKEISYIHAEGLSAGETETWFFGFN